MIEHFIKIHKKQINKVKSFVIESNQTQKSVSKNLCPAQLIKLIKNTQIWVFFVR